MNGHPDRGQSGVTWMLYYQIRHLQALDAYLELMGVDDASKLVAGKGKPPQEDPQVFLGAMSLGPTPPPKTRHLLLSYPVSSHIHIRTPLFSVYFLDINYFISLAWHSFLFFALDNTSFLSTERCLTFVDNQRHFIIDMHDGIRHPRFLRISKTEYAFNNPTSVYQEVVHVGQISKFLNFDKLLREGRLPNNISGVPLGYLEFANSFNTGTHPQDKRRLSTYISTPTGDHVVKSTEPVSLHDFHITLEQCGLASPHRNTLTEDQAFVFQEYATVMASQTKRRREAFQARDDKRRNQFHQSKKNLKGNNRYNPYVIDLCDSESNASFAINNFVDQPQASTSRPTPEPIGHLSEIQAHSVNYYNSEADPLVPEFSDALDEGVQEALQPMELQE
jgi:hypothetical protein